MGVTVWNRTVPPHDRRLGVDSAVTNMTPAEATTLAVELARQLGLVVVDPELARTLQLIDFTERGYVQDLASNTCEELSPTERCARLEELIKAVVEKVLTAALKEVR